MRFDVPSNPVMAAIAAPFLSGGGRGVLWFLLQLAAIAAWAFTLSAG